MKILSLTLQKWAILSLIVLGGIFFVIFVGLHQAGQNANTNDWLVFRRIFDFEKGVFEVLITSNGDPQQVISLGHYRGVPSLSRDGKYLAVSCLDDYSQICILDLQGLDAAKSAKNRAFIPHVLKTISLPEACKDTLSNLGLESISWSFNDTKLAIVCGDVFNQAQKQTCILPLAQGEKSNCWETPDDAINRVEWSPIDDRLLVSSLNKVVGKIYLIDEPSQAAHFLTLGWGASWAPDGQQISFLQWLDDYFTVVNGETVPKEGVSEIKAGLAIMHIDGTNFKWVYKTPDGPLDFNPGKISFSCTDSLAECNTSWSPDGEFIAFNGVTLGMYNIHLFKINLITSEITQISAPDLTDRIRGSRSNSTPSWGK